MNNAVTYQWALWCSSEQKSADLSDMVFNAILSVIRGAVLRIFK